MKAGRLEEKEYRKRELKKKRESKERKRLGIVKQGKKEEKNERKIDRRKRL